MVRITREEPFLSRPTGIVIAADVATLHELRALVELAVPVAEVVAIKVGFSLALRYGLPAVVRLVHEISPLPIIYDHQKAGTDIPQMGEPFAVLCRDAGVKGVIFFPLSGPKTLEGFVYAAIENELEPIVGLVMTHPSFLQSEGGFIADSAPDLICSLAVAMGVRSFVLPGTKTDIVSKFAQGELARVEFGTIMMPGIGSQGGSLAAAFKAAEPHRRLAIIGSAIYNAPDPKAALATFAAESRQ